MPPPSGTPSLPYPLQPLCTLPARVQPGVDEGGLEGPAHQLRSQSHPCVFLRMTHPRPTREVPGLFTTGQPWPQAILGAGGGASWAGGGGLSLGSCGGHPRVPRYHGVWGFNPCQGELENMERFLPSLACLGLGAVGVMGRERGIYTDH